MREMGYSQVGCMIPGLPGTMRSSLIELETRFFSAVNLNDVDRDDEVFSMIHEASRRITGPYKRLYAD